MPWAHPSLQDWPATRHDGGTGGSFPEGARIRLDPSVTCPHDTAGTSGPTQLAYDRAFAFCETIRKYGMVVTDQTGGGTELLVFATPIGGKDASWTPDGGNCCSGKPGGTQWPNWYWDHEMNALVPHFQVIDPSYRPPFAPAQ